MGNIRSYLPKDTKRVKIIGLPDRPSDDIVDDNGKLGREDVKGRYNYYLLRFT